MTDTLFEIPDTPVKKGESFAMGWEYYESRAIVGVALADFDLGERFRQFRTDNLHRDHSDDDEGYYPAQKFLPDFLKSLVEQGLATSVTPVVVVRVSCEEYERLKGVDRWGIYREPEQP